MRQAQTELQKAALEATKAQQDVEQEMDSFEKKKLKDIKVVLFIHYVMLDNFLIQLFSGQSKT